MRSAVLLLSGGLDSAANLVLSDQFQVKLALTIDYGQRGVAREVDRAARLARHFGVEHVVYPLKDFAQLVSNSSGLFAGGTGSVPVPESLNDLKVTQKTAQAVWVPNRNGVLLSLAAALAESRGLNAVAVGFNAEEAVTFPDNTETYMEAMTRALSYSTANQVAVVSATSSLTKVEIVRKLAERPVSPKSSHLPSIIFSGAPSGSSLSVPEPGFPFDLLWSCYHAGEKHCGQCESCQRLKRALTAGLPDSHRTDILGRVFS